LTIVAYEPAFGIIGNPMKKEPKTRQSADHSMAYIVATLLRKACALYAGAGLPVSSGSHDAIWKALMLDPWDYQESDSAIFEPEVRALMQRIEFVHGGAEYDAKYPDGIPTSISINGVDSGLVMYPAGHARNTDADLEDILRWKWALLGDLALPEGADVQGFVDRFEGIGGLDSFGISALYDFELGVVEGYEEF
jgi:2-methylcitrate dehydratase